MSKDKKLSKSAKAALPIFALFGGQGFASSRNPLTMQSSKKLAGKSVVYINETDKPQLPTLKSNQLQKAKSPFAAFTNQAVIQSKNTNFEPKSNTMRFLNKNKLLTSNKTSPSELSGNISSENQKSFSHAWTLTTGGGSLYTAAKTGFFSCTFSSNPTNQNISMVYNLYGNGNASCIASYSIGGFIAYKTLFGVPVASCIALHDDCDNQILPVELQKFEIE